MSNFKFVFIDKNRKSTFVDKYEKQGNGDIKVFIRNKTEEGDEQEFTIKTIKAVDTEGLLIKVL